MKVTVVPSEPPQSRHQHVRLHTSTGVVELVNVYAPPATGAETDDAHAELHTSIIESSAARRSRAFFEPSSLRAKTNLGLHGARLVVGSSLMYVLAFVSASSRHCPGLPREATALRAARLPVRRIQQARPIGFACVRLHCSRGPLQFFGALCFRFFFRPAGLRVRARAPG